MNKFVADKEELLEIITDMTQKINPSVNSADIEPIMEKALDNFNREMKIPYEEVNTLPDEVKNFMVNILIKHFVISLNNDQVMISKNVWDVVEQLERLFY